MRIRSIRPEFWSSEDISALAWEHRLIFIGLWSYVDDNGVGRDMERLITADLFPLEEDTHGALTQVTGALKTLEAHGLITRYKVDGKRYVHITTWDKHQKINRPSGSRYPLPTCDDAVSHGGLTEPSVSPQALSTVGEGEKGRRGEEQTCSSATAESDFDEWYEVYPRKVGKGQAVKAYKLARKKADARVLLDALKAQRPALVSKGDFIPHPATWLNGERWLDETATPGPVGFPHEGTQAEKDAWVAAQPLPADGAYYGGSRR